MSEQELQQEIVRLNKVVEALMNRVERSDNVQGEDFNLFHTAVLLEEQVRRRTEELEAALNENERITRALRESENKFRALVHQSLVGFTLYDGQHFVYANPRFIEMTGYGMEELRGLSAMDLAPEEGKPKVERIIAKAFSRDFRPGAFVADVKCKDGQVMNAEIAGVISEIGGKPHLLSVWTDVTERVKVEREVQELTIQLQEQAIRDPLTRLHNRRYFDESLARELAIAARKGYTVSIVMGDIDHFKSINDTYGHQTGDEVLKVFAALLLQNSRTSDICCRYGGEEFMLVMPDVSLDLACQRAEAIREEILQKKFAHAGHQFVITASFGVASFPVHGPSSDALTAAADAALYDAKGAGRNRVCCR